MFIALNDYTDFGTANIILTEEEHKEFVDKNLQLNEVSSISKVTTIFYQLEKIIYINE